MVRSEHPLRRLISKILHMPGAGSDFELAYVHRGAPEDIVKIRISTIRQVRKGSFLLEDLETQIPFHRIVYVKKLSDSSILWQKRARPLPTNRSR